MDPVLERVRATTVAGVERVALSVGEQAVGRKQLVGPAGLNVSRVAAKLHAQVR